MAIVTEANAELLFGVRLAVDGPFADEAKVRREVFKYSMQLDGRCAFLYEQDGRVWGYVEVILGESLPSDTLPLVCQQEAHIARIGVVAECRGKGVGKALLRTAERWLKSIGARAVWLDYLSDNQSAAHLYHTSGYEDIAEFADTRGRARKIAVKTL